MTMFNNFPYEKSVHQRHKDLQRELEQLRLLARLRWPRHSLSRYLSERSGIFLRELGMKLKQGVRIEADAK